RKLEGLTYGRFGYSKNPNAALAFNDDLVARGNQKATIRKFEGLSDGLYGYQKQHSLKPFIDKLVQSRNPLGLYFYTLGLKFGLFGFKQDEEQAKRFILENGIPY
ncbi:MAG TPA: hypothetical protein VMW10_00205, partial [Alphaproteobacteria bacterium]|nr:hypothetical protein [Alphaproteobacteria bacterium]